MLNGKPHNHKFANPAKIDSLKNEKWRDVNFNEPERVIEFTELTFGEKQRMEITAFNNQIFIQDKKEIKFTNSGLVLSLSSAKEELSKVSVYYIKDNNIVVTTKLETFVFSLKGKLLNQLSGRFYPVFVRFQSKVNFSGKKIIEHWF